MNLFSAFAVGIAIGSGIVFGMALNITILGIAVTLLVPTVARWVLKL